MSSFLGGFLNNRLFQPASLSRNLTSGELRRLKSIKLYFIVVDTLLLFLPGTWCGHTRRRDPQDEALELVGHQVFV